MNNKENLKKELLDMIELAKKEERGFTEDEKTRQSAIEAELEQLRDLAKAESLAESIKVEEKRATKEPVTRSEPVVEVVRKEGAEDELYRGFVKNLAGQDLTRDEQRALEAGTATEGGNVVPTVFDTKVRERIRLINPFRRLGAETIQTDNDRNIAIETTQPTAAVIAEEGTFTESDPAWGQITLSAFKLGNIVKVSDELLSDSFINVEQYLVKKFSEAIAYKEEQQIISGAGTTEVQGLDITTAVGGLSVTNVDITGSGTAVTADELKDMLYTMKPQYRNSASSLVWVMSNNTMKSIAKLKDADNRYLLNDSLRGISGRDDDMLLGAPVIVSDHMPDMAEDTKSFLLLDLKHLLIGDRGPLRVKRLDELYAATGQVGFRFDKRFDSLLTNSEAMITGTNNAI